MNALNKFLLGTASIVMAVGAAVAGVSYASSVTPFTGPSGTNAPPEMPPGLGTLNTMIKNDDAAYGFNPMCAAAAVTSIATCQGLRGTVTSVSLALSQGAATSITVTDASVNANSIIECTESGYGGTFVTNGVPVVVECLPGAGTFLVEIANLSTGATALAGTVAASFAVFN